MRLYLPKEGFTVTVPGDWPSLGGSPAFVHQSLWDQYGRPGDVCLTRDLDPKSVVDFLTSKKARAVLQKNDHWFEKDFETLVYLFHKPTEFFENPAKAVLRKALKILSWDFTSPSDKERIKKNCFTHVEAGNHVIRESVAAVFEELFMNATIDAPRSSLARKLESQAYEKHGPARLHLSVEPGRLCLACEDPYGTLDVEKFVGRMHEVYTRGAGAAVNLESHMGGAGLGCVMLFEHSANLFVGAQPGQRSVVACVLPTDLSHREKDGVQKSLCVLKG